jgi:hypothetical protein
MPMMRGFNAHPTCVPLSWKDFTMAVVHWVKIKLLRGSQRIFSAPSLGLGQAYSGETNLLFYGGIFLSAVAYTRAWKIITRRRVFATPPVDYNVKRV